MLRSPLPPLSGCFSSNTDTDNSRAFIDWHTEQIEWPRCRNDELLLAYSSVWTSAVLSASFVDAVPAAEVPAQVTALVCAVCPGEALLLSVSTFCALHVYPHCVDDWERRCYVANRSLLQSEGNWVVVSTGAEGTFRDVVGLLTRRITRYPGGSEGSDRSGVWDTSSDSDY